MPVEKQKVPMPKRLLPWGQDGRIEEWIEEMHKSGFYVSRVEEEEEVMCEETTQVTDKRIPVTDTSDGVAFAKNNPTTIDLLVELGIEKNYKAAQKKILAAVNKKELEWIGKVKQEKGAPKKVVSGYPSNIASHELLGTRFRGAYLDVAVERGPNLEKNCDLIWRFSESMWAYVEIDSGLVSHPKQEGRWVDYVGSDGVVIMATDKPGRLKNLQAHAKAIASMAVFAVLRDIVEDPWGEVYETINGVRIKLMDAWE